MIGNAIELEVQAPSKMLSAKWIAINRNQYGVHPNEESPALSQLPSESNGLLQFSCYGEKKKKKKGFV